MPTLTEEILRLLGPGAFEQDIPPGVRTMRADAVTPSVLGAGFGAAGPVAPLGTPLVDTSKSLADIMLSARNAAFQRVSPSGSASNRAAQDPLNPPDDILTPRGTPAPSEIAQTGGLLKQLGDALGNPQTQRLLAQLGMALTSRDQNDVGFQLSAVAAERATEQVTAQALAKALAGESLTAQDLAALPREVQAQVVQEQRATRAEGREERQLTAGEKLTDARVKGIEAGIVNEEGRLDLARAGQEFDVQQANRLFGEEVRQFNKSLKLQEGQLDIAKLNATSSRISANASALSAQSLAELRKVEGALGELQLEVTKGQVLGLDPDTQLRQFTQLAGVAGEVARAKNNLAESSKAIALQQLSLTDEKGSVLPGKEEEYQALETALSSTNQQIASFDTVLQKSSTLMSGLDPTQTGQTNIIQAGDIEALAKLPPGVYIEVNPETGKIRYMVKAAGE